MAIFHTSEMGGDPEKMRAFSRNMRDHMGPQAVDQACRSAISLCWMMLPDDKKNIDTVETEIRRLMDRALKDLREDAGSFGISLS